MKIRTSKEIVTDAALFINELQGRNRLPYEEYSELFDTMLGYLGEMYITGINSTNPKEVKNEK